MRLVLCREVVGVYLAYHTKTANTHSGTRRRFCSFEAGGTALMKPLGGMDVCRF